MMERIRNIGSLIFLTTVWFIGCSLPEMPNRVSWDVEVSFPIANKTYALWELVDEDSVLMGEGSGIGMTLPDSALFFQYREDLEPISIASQLRLAPMSYEIEQQIQTLRVPIDLEQSEQVSLSDLNPTLANRHGSNVVVQSFDFSQTRSFPISDNFIQACVDSGWLDVQVTSTLDFAFSEMKIDWVSDREDPVTLYSGGLDACAATSVNPSLASRCLAGEMELEISGSTAGGESIIVDSTQGFEVMLSIGDVTVSSFIGYVPRQTRTIDSVYAFEQQHEIYEGEIAEGALNITMTNQSVIADSVRFILNDLLSPDGEPIAIEQFAAPGQSVQMELNLSGYTLRLENPARQEVRARLEAILLPSDEPVEFEAGNQRVVVGFSIGDITFRRFDGCVHELVADIEPQALDVEEPPDGSEGLQLTTLNARLHLPASAPLDCDIGIILLSENDAGILGEYHQDVSLFLGEDTTVFFDGLEALVPQLPTRFLYSGSVVLNGRAVLYDTTQLRGSLEMTAPLRFVLENLTVTGDVERVDSEPLEDLLDVELRVKVWNALPLTGRLTMIAAWDSAAVAENSGLPADTFFSIVLPQAMFSQGQVSEVGCQELLIHPPESSFHLLREPPFFMRTELDIDDSDGDTLSAYGFDYIRYEAVATVRYRLSAGGE